MADIFIDESGQFNKHNYEEYFVMGSFTVDDPHGTSKAFRAWYKSRFPKKMRGQNEIKWSSTGIEDVLRTRTLKFISKSGVHIRFVYLAKKNIPKEYRRKGKLEEGLLYTDIAKDLLDMYFPVTDQDFRVFCDRKSLSGMTNQEFKVAVMAHIKIKTDTRPIIRVETVDSASNTNIQIADWISGALARYLEKGPQGGEFYDILKNNIVGKGKELFRHKKVRRSELFW